MTRAVHSADGIVDRKFNVARNSNGTFPTTPAVLTELGREALGEPFDPHPSIGRDEAHGFRHVFQRDIEELHQEMS